LEEGFRGGNRSRHERQEEPGVHRDGLEEHHATITKEDLVVLKELIEAGKVTPAIDRSYQLSEVPDAVRYLGDGRARAKIIITV
jgi:NADPH:quinone reductase-like Zn-dependent oxidoreductase